jgi:RHS repeat-associated protein
VQEIENSAVSANYIRTLSIDEPLARLTPNALRFYQTDALGSVIALTDDTGAVKTTYSYDPFGSVTVNGEASDNPFQYTGRENDGTGLYYYRARYYSPELQRFVSEDPIRFRSGDVNFFIYVGNSPLNWVDPFGLEKIITIEENCSCPYGASVTVTDTDTNNTVFSGRGSTLPNNPGQQNTVASGTYSGTNTTRASGGPGVYIGNPPTAPGSPGSTATEIFIHCGYSETWRGSAGCLTIQPSQCEEFFRIFGKEEPVTVNIGR